MQGWDSREKEEFTKELLKKHGEVGEMGFLDLSSEFAHAFVVTPGWRLLPEVSFLISFPVSLLSLFSLFFFLSSHLKQNPQKSDEELSNGESNGNEEEESDSERERLHSVMEEKEREMRDRREEEKRKEKRDRKRGGRTRSSPLRGTNEGYVPPSVLVCLYLAKNYGR